MELKGLRGAVVLLVAVWLAMASGCMRPYGPAQTPIKPKTVAELEEYLRNDRPELDQFKLGGPFAVAAHKEHELRLSSAAHFKADLFSPTPADKAPLVIFVHGYESSKEAHANQAMHVASWGMHALTLQLSKTGPWIGNGRTLARIVALIHRSPELLDSRIDTSRIVLVGHSFGAVSVSVALAEGAPAVGAVLLDPAAAARDVPKYLQRITKPVMVLGADDALAPARNRDWFYRFVRSGIAEVSIRGAVHEDAQYPSEFALQHFGLDPDTTEEMQITFAGALTAAAYGVAATGALDYAWGSYGAALKNGKLFNAKRK